MPDETLMIAARAAAKRAYCPYSKFHVGAAVKIKGGLVFSGSNIENASYGLTCCAERVAIFSAVSSCLSDAKPEIVEIAVTCPDLSDGFAPQYSMCCGACRQVLSEFASPECIVVVDRVGQFTMDELLPKAFKL